MCHTFIPLLFLLPVASVGHVFLLRSPYFTAATALVLAALFFTSFETCLPQFIFFIYVVKEWKETAGVIYDNIIVSI